MKRIDLETSFNSFYNQTYKSAMQYCLMKTGDFINSEDLLSDAYYAIYKRISKEDAGEIEDLNRYLFTVLKNGISKYWKKHRRDLLMTVSSDDEDNYEALLETDFNLTEETAEREMLLQDILEFVSKQPAPMRRAFTMHFYLDKSIEECAKELDAPVTTVRNHIYRLLHKVQDHFMDSY